MCDCAGKSYRLLARSGGPFLHLGLAILSAAQSKLLSILLNFILVLIILADLSSNGTDNQGVVCIFMYLTKTSPTSGPHLNYPCSSEMDLVPQYSFINGHHGEN